MPLRYRLAALFLLLALVTSGTTAFAAKPAPVITPLGGAGMDQMIVAPPRYTHTTCTLGEVGTPAYIVDYLLPPDDGYYTLVDPAACGCPGNSVLLTNIKILLNFRAACAQPVEISVVGAVGDVACWSPDPTNILCPPSNWQLQPPAPGNYIFTMPILSDCCLSGPAFIVVKFGPFGAGCTTSTTWPRLITTNGCESCVSYNIWPGGFDELCSVGFPGNPVISSDADCCNTTSTRHGTWGGVKILYR
jgi:hypothetical protein